MVVLREYHSSEKDFILNYLKDQQNISERVDVKKMPSIDEVLRSQLKMFPISSDQGQGEMKRFVLDIPTSYSVPPTIDKSSVIETKIRGILANKQPTDFAVKMFEPLNNVVKKPVTNVKPPTKPASAKSASQSNAIKPRPPQKVGAKGPKSVKIKTPETKVKQEAKLAGVVKKDKQIKPKAKSVVKALINSGTKPAAVTKVPRAPATLKSRATKPLAGGRKIKKIKVDKQPKVVKQGSVSFPRLVKLEKPVPKTLKRKKLVKTPEKKVGKPGSLPLRIA